MGVHVDAPEDGPQPYTERNWQRLLMLVRAHAGWPVTTRVPTL
jgi:hypothetical protein